MPEQANAMALLKRRTDAEWDLAMGPYWDSLPEADMLMTKEMMPASALPLLQDSTMVFCAHSPQSSNMMVTTALKHARGLLIKAP